MNERVGPAALPDDPVLAAVATTLNETGFWAHVLDANWRYVFETDEQRSTFVDISGGSVPPLPIGSHFFSAEVRKYFAATVGGPLYDVENYRAFFLDAGRFVLGSARGGRDELRDAVDPAVVDLVDELSPQELPAMRVQRHEWISAGIESTTFVVFVRIDDGHGCFAGVCVLSKPAVGMSDLARSVALADPSHLQRMRAVDVPGRRPAAILMADLEASTPLAQQLPTAQYFAFGRRLVRTFDQCVIDAGGIVSRHAGDGVVGFFLAEVAGSESAAARGCITAARTLRDSLPAIAARSEIHASNLSLRFGLHWGATLYVGRILTGGRSEVAALGEEANEAARIEACATGGRTLASKALLERLNRADAAVLAIDTDHITYTALAELVTATEKARRDAPSIAVCEV